MRDTPYRDADAHSQPIRLLIADDHESVRAGLRSLFEPVTHVEVVEEAGDTAAVVESIRSLALDVVVLDLSMPQLGGLATIRLVKAEKPEIAIVVLTRFQDPSFVREALAAGASAYVLKQSSFSQLRHAVDAVVRGGQYLDRSLEGVLESVAFEKNAAVSVREGDVLRRTALGQSNKDIAAGMNISIRTVEVHKTSGMRKLGLRDRTELVRYASVQGWLAEP